MKKQKGLAFKTFTFTFIVITLVITVSFGLLYFMLPSHYLSEKEKALEKNAAAFEASLNEAATLDECTELIADFAKSNNSTVISFNSHNSVMPELSSPFLMMDGREEFFISLSRVTERIGDDDGKTDMQITITEKSGPAAPAEDKINLGYMDEGKAIIIRHETSSAFITKRLNNGLIGHITISSTLQPIDEAKDVLISLIPYLLIIDFIIALLASFIFANQLTKPILTISNAAALMREMKPGVLSNVNSCDELGQLSHNLDSLYLSLCENIDSLKHEMDKTAKLEQSKTDFMRAAGHELKTPIAALNGMMEGMIDNVGVYKNHDKYLNESKEQISKLAKLVNEILMAAKLEHATEGAELEDINLNDIVCEVVLMYKILIEKKQLQIEREDFDFEYRTDRNMLLTAVSNLISNAVNYTGQGGRIIISFKDNGNEHILSIENECEAICDETLPKLFEPFFTGDYSRNKSESGTGLGLYIVKKNLDTLKLPFEIGNTEIGLRIDITFYIPSLY